MTVVTELAGEINLLRRGWGLRLVDPSRVGPLLRHFCALGPDDYGSEVEVQVRQHVNAALAELPDDPRMIVAAGLCLHPEAELRRFEERVSWLAERFRISERTVLRRMDEAIRMLAAAMWQANRLPRPAQEPGDGWYVESLSTILILDGAQPEALERRIIIATQDNLQKIATNVSVPRHKGDDSISHDLQVDVLHGGSIRLREQEYESLFRQVIMLPEPLNVGDKHEYVIRRSVPAGQPMAPHYVHIPLKRRVDRFDLRIRFNKVRPPAAVWRLTGAPPAVVYDLGPASDVLEPNTSMEVHAEFDDLQQGHAYGICWRE
jgi:hypothetical protein